MTRAQTIKQTEGAPASYPDLGSPSPLSETALALDADFLWQRIEAYIVHRWTERSVEWIAEGPGEWTPPLSPASVTAVAVWQDDTWQTVTLSASPLGGYVLPGCGPYRFTATVGGGSPAPVAPATVLEAFRRLAEYAAAKAGKAGASSESLTAGTISLSHRRSPSWMAQAIENSGAGDLLRPFRRL